MISVDKRTLVCERIKISVSKCTTCLAYSGIRAIVITVFLNMCVQHVLGVEEARPTFLA